MVPRLSEGAPHGGRRTGLVRLLLRTMFPVFFGFYGSWDIVDAMDHGTTSDFVARGASTWSRRDQLFLDGMRIALGRSDRPGISRLVAEVSSARPSARVLARADEDILAAPHARTVAPMALAPPMDRGITSAVRMSHPLFSRPGLSRSASAPVTAGYGPLPPVLPFGEAGTRGAIDIPPQPAAAGEGRTPFSEFFVEVFVLSECLLAVGLKNYFSVAIAVLLVIVVVCVWVEGGSDGVVASSYPDVYALPLPNDG